MVREAKKMERPRNPHLENGIYLCGLIFLGLIVLWAAAGYFLKLEFNLPPCLFHRLTGLYCPGCGGTRAVRLLFTGHIWKSFLYHPGVLFAAVLYLWFMVSQTIERFSNGKLKVGLPYSDKFLYWEMAVILLQCLIKNLVKISLGIGIL